MDFFDDMGLSKLSANVFFFLKVNYSFNADVEEIQLQHLMMNVKLNNVLLKSSL